MALHAAIVPHAPLLLPSIARAGRLDKGEPLRQALAKLGPWDTEAATIIISAHARRAGVYQAGRGDLNAFGLRSHEVEKAIDEPLSARCAGAWKRSRLAGLLDHGAVVPAMLKIFPPGPVVIAALPQISGPHAMSLDEALDDAVTLADALEEMATELDLNIFFSAHTSAALSSVAPLSERPGAIELEDEIMSKAAADAGVFSSMARELALVGGACGAAVLAVLGRLFGGNPLQVIEYDRPFGVGYLVATIDR